MDEVEVSTQEMAQKLDGSLVKQVHRRVELVKADRRMEVEYMTLLERDRKNIEEGITKWLFLCKFREK